MQKEPLTFEDTAYLDSMRQRQVPLNHIHWDGSIPATDLFKLYEARGKELLLPENDFAGNPIEYESAKDRVIDSPEKLRDFQEALFRPYGIVDVFAIPTGAMQTKKDLIAMARAHCRYLKEQNVPYAETRFAPLYHTQEELSMDEVIGYALEGFAQGSEETGVVVRPIVCINREVDGEVAQDIVRATLPYEGYDVITQEHSFEPTTAQLRKFTY